MMERLETQLWLTEKEQWRKEGALAERTFWHSLFTEEEVKQAVERRNQKRREAKEKT